ncbi:MAG TPA: RNA polymerase sigma factor [Steroidobacteraceae bacterium]|nr:RNA polymerase sigma factor [Steroidobacteraceae bacterium]
MDDSVTVLRANLPGTLPRLRRFARTLARNVTDADDLVQGALERALSRAAQWRAPPAGATPAQIEVAVRSWMFGIVKNAWIDSCRARSRERAVFAGDERIAAIADGSHGAMQDGLSVDAAMQHLPEEQRLAVALVLVEGLSYQEAADVMEVPVGTLTSRLSRGRETLAHLLGGPEAPR